MTTEPYTQRLAKLPATHYLDNRIYLDPDIFAEERRRIFERAWNFVCLASEAPNPGDFRVVTVAGHSLLIVRGEDGRLRAFYNICTHRAAPLVRQERGNGKAFQCFYHLWTFGLDGSLRGVTKPEGYEGTGFCKDDFGLVEVRVDTVAGLVFVCLSDETGSLQDYLGAELVARMEKTLGQVELEAFHYHKAVVRTNWKLWNDNNSEIYHNFLHPFNRKTTAEAMYTHTGHVLYPNGHALMITTDPRARVQYGAGGVESREGVPAFPGLHGNGNWLANIFPDLLLLIRGTVLRIDRMVPLAPGQTLVEWRGVAIKGDSPDVRVQRIRHHNQIWGPMGRNLPEDILAVEEQWRQMSSQAVVGYSVYAREHEPLPDGRLQALDDGNMRAYYQTWGRWMGRAPQAPFGEGAAPPGREERRVPEAATRPLRQAATGG